MSASYGRRCRDVNGPPAAAQNGLGPGRGRIWPRSDLAKLGSGQAPPSLVRPITRSGPVAFAGPELRRSFGRRTNTERLHETLHLRAGPRPRRPPSSRPRPSPPTSPAPARPSRSRSTPSGPRPTARTTGIGLNYQSIGSGGGIQQIQAKTVDFGATDAPLKGQALDEGRPRPVPDRASAASSPW